jgi:hypothetical protein
MSRKALGAPPDTGMPVRQSVSVVLNSNRSRTLEHTLAGFSRLPRPFLAGKHRNQGGLRLDGLAHHGIDVDSRSIE